MFWTKNTVLLSNKSFHCEIGLGACEDAWSLPAMLACYHGLCNQAKEKRTCGALPLGPKETHHKLEARGRGALFWALVR